MTYSIQLGLEQVAYTLRVHPRARRMILAVYPGGKLVVTVPKRHDGQAIERLLLNKQTWIIKTLQKYQQIPERSKRRNSRTEYLLYKEQARKLIHDRIKFFNAFYKFTFNKIAIKNQSTLWGSCSRRRNLNFNYRLALLPPELADYIIVHELCHLQEMNHSKRFWDLVVLTISDHKARRMELRNRHAHLF